MILKVIIEEVSADIAENICKKIINDLPEHFGSQKWNEKYPIRIKSYYNFAAKVNDDYVGLLTVYMPYPRNAYIYWLGVLKKHQRMGIGKLLVEKSCEYARKNGAITIVVDTLSPKEEYEPYLSTYNFYLSYGFHSMFDLRPHEDNLVYMVKAL